VCARQTPAELQGALTTKPLLGSGALPFKATKFLSVAELPADLCKAALWGQCGGSTGCLPGLPCGNFQWTCCSDNAVCQPHAPTYWQCVPALRSEARDPEQQQPPGGAPVMPPVDDLQIAAPAVARAGAPVNVTALFTRAGMDPIPGHGVRFTIITTGGSTGPCSRP
jgi:hypothetical protein